MEDLICLTKLVCCMYLLFAQCYGANQAAGVQPLSVSTAPNVSSGEVCRTYDYELRSGYVVIHIPSGKEQQSSFILDTGSPTLLSQEFAGRLKLSLKPVSERYSVSSDLKRRFVGLTKLTKSRFGPLPLDRAELLVVPSNVLPVITGYKTMGVLGYEVFDHGALLFDPIKQTITVWKKGHVSGTALQKLGMGKASILPLIPLSSGGYGIRVSLNGISCIMRVDTGAAHSVITNKLAHQLKLNSQEAIQRSTFFGRIEARRSQVRSFVVGKYNMSDTYIEYPADFNFPLPPLLGLDFLTRFRILLDFPARQVYLLPKA